ncbi:hypothetical protein GQ43DRAFT_367939, partial [Delitschia confertaspora ATCC 74209]
YFSQAELGLGHNSSFLSTLRSAGRISARAFSFFWGWVGSPNKKPGSLVLGGVDQSIGGKSENFTTPLSYGKSPCATGMLVTINDISLNWPNGTDSSIFMGSQSSVIQACIVPNFAGLMTLPYEYWVKFVDLAGGKPATGIGTPTNGRTIGINFYTMLFRPEDVFYGDLIISIQNGIRIRIPNTELVVPEMTIAKDGQVEANTLLRNIVINSIQNVNEDDLPQLDRLLFTSAYLMVNHDANTFTLWQADAGAGSPELKAVGEHGEVIEEFCANTTSPTSNETSSRSETSPSSALSPEKRDMSGAVIGGIIAAAVGGVAVLSCITFFFLRRRRSNRALVFEGENISMWEKPPTPPYHSRPNLFSPSELPPYTERKVAQMEPQELDSRILER